MRSRYLVKRRTYGKSCRRANIGGKLYPSTCWNKWESYGGHISQTQAVAEAQRLAQPLRTDPDGQPYAPQVAVFFRGKIVAGPFVGKVQP